MIILGVEFLKLFLGQGDLKVPLVQRYNRMMRLFLFELAELYSGQCDLKVPLVHRYNRMM